MNILDKITEYSIPVVESVSSFDTVDELLAHVKPLKGLEGFVLAFDNGHRVKVKADEYVRIHRVKDLIRSDRHILDLILNGGLDDCLPLFDAEDRARIEEYDSKFQIAFQREWDVLCDLFAKAKTFPNKRAVALEFIPTLEKKEYARFIFSNLDGKDCNALFLEFCKKSVTNNANYDQLAKVFEL